MKRLTLSFWVTDTMEAALRQVSLRDGVDVPTILEAALRRELALRDGAQSAAAVRARPDHQTISARA
mgnify:CR=1 FL=1